MKLIGLISLLFVLGSCHKKTETATSHDFSLPGTWRLFSEVGGIAGINKTFPVSDGHWSFTFRADSTCTEVSGTNTSDSHYSIRNDSSYACMCLRPFIYIGSTRRYEFSHAHDTLWLADDAVADGMAY